MRDKLVDKDITKLLINMGNHVSLHQLIPPEDGLKDLFTLTGIFNFSASTSKAEHLGMEIVDHIGITRTEKKLHT